VQEAESTKRRQQEAMVEVRRELESQQNDWLQEMPVAMDDLLHVLGHSMEVIFTSVEGTEQRLRSDIESMNTALKAVDSRPCQCNEMVQALQLGQEREDLSPGSLPSSVTMEAIESLRALVQAARSDSTQKLAAMGNEEHAELGRTVADAKRRAGQVVETINGLVNRLEVVLQRIKANQLDEQLNHYRNFTFEVLPPVAGAAEAESLLEQDGEQTFPATAALDDATAPPMLIEDAGTPPTSGPTPAVPVTLERPTPALASAPMAASPLRGILQLRRSCSDVGGEQKTQVVCHTGCSQQGATLHASAGILKMLGSLSQLQLQNPSGVRSKQLAGGTSAATMTPVCLSTVVSSTALVPEPPGQPLAVPSPVPSSEVAPSGSDHYCHYYLPKVIRGVPVLTKEAENVWRVDNTMLKSTAAGLGYRSSKTIDDCTYIVAGGGDLRGEVAAHWGARVEGVDEGDGWVRCRFQPAEGPSVAVAAWGQVKSVLQENPSPCTVQTATHRDGTTRSPSCKASRRSARFSRDVAYPEVKREVSTERRPERKVLVACTPKATTPRWRVGSPTTAVRMRSYSPIASTIPCSKVMASPTTTKATAYSPTVASALRVLSPGATAIASNACVRVLSPVAAAVATAIGKTTTRQVAGQFPRAFEAAHNVLAKESIIQRLDASQDNFVRTIRKVEIMSPRSEVVAGAGSRAADDVPRVSSMSPPVRRATSPAVVMPRQAQTSTPRLPCHVGHGQHAVLC
jgi:hypothetical protein